MMYDGRSVYASDSEPSSVRAPPPQTVALTAAAETLARTKSQVSCYSAASSWSASSLMQIPNGFTDDYFSQEWSYFSPHKINTRLSLHLA